MVHEWGKKGFLEAQEAMIAAEEGDHPCEWYSLADSSTLSQMLSIPK